MKLYAAIDLHSNNSVLAVIDDQDRVLVDQRLPNDLAAVLRAIEPFRGELVAVAVESTYNWYWLVDGLIEHGIVTRLVHTSAVPQYAGLKHGDDHSDARHLARLLRLGILPEGYIYPRNERAVRDLLRRRFHLVHQATNLMHVAQGMWSRRTGSGLNANAFRRLTPAQILTHLPSPLERLALQTQIDGWKALQIQITRIEREVSTQLRGSCTLDAVRTIPGIGVILGSTVTLETGEITRFAQVGDYVSYSRMVESRRLSNGKTKGRGNAKCGNRYLCWAYIEAANLAKRFCPEIQRWYDRKLRASNKVIAIKATAHKLARASYFLMRDGGVFDPQRAFG
jgi:transposase